MAQIKVYRKDTGQIVRVPEHFMDHPVLSKPFRKTPSQRVSEEVLATQERADIERRAVEVLHQSSTEEQPSEANPSQSASAGDDKKE